MMTKYKTICHNNKTPLGRHEFLRYHNYITDDTEDLIVGREYYIWVMESRYRTNEDYILFLDYDVAHNVKEADLYEIGLLPSIPLRDLDKYFYALEEMRNNKINELIC